MEAIQHFTKQSLKSNAPQLQPGDTVRVHQKIREGNKERIQIFEGLVIKVQNGQGINGSYTVRRIASNGIGVEKTFPLHSPNVAKVERVKSSTVRRARLFYMRERFGRMARMKGEVRNAADWDESTAEAIPSEESVEAAATGDSSDEPMVKEQTPEETTETPTEEVVREEVETESPAPDAHEDKDAESPLEKAVEPSPEQGGEQSDEPAEATQGEDTKE